MGRCKVLSFLINLSIIARIGLMTTFDPIVLRYVSSSKVRVVYWSQDSGKNCHRPHFCLQGIPSTQDSRTRQTVLE